MTNVTVHVVDDDESVRKALVRLLSVNGYQTRSYQSAGEFLMTPRADDSGCLLLDINMPGPNGLELQESLTKQKGALPVIFLTGYGDISTSVRAMKAGAVDFLTKPVQPEPLIQAIDKAIEKNRATQEQLDGDRELKAKYQKLTARERQVFSSVTQGLLNKQIAAELGTSERTIKAHRAQVMDKMEARSVADLVRAADKLIPDEGTEH